MRTQASHPGDREAEPARRPPSPATALQRGAARHLWPHFAALGAERPTVFVRGEGCYLWDESGRRHLDALSSLFCVNAGHGRAALAEAAAGQARTLAYATTWGTGAPARDRARRADRRPGARRSRPRVLHVGRLGVRRVRAEARPGVPPRARRARPVQGDRPRARLPRHDAGGAERHGPAFRPGAVRAAPARRLPRRRTRTSTGSRPAATRCGPPTRSRSGSRSRARRPSPP